MRQLRKGAARRFLGDLRKNTAADGIKEKVYPANADDVAKKRRCRSRCVDRVEVCGGKAAISSRAAYWNLKAGFVSDKDGENLPDPPDFRQALGHIKWPSSRRW